LTSWPGVRDDLVNAGATWLDQPFVRDGNLATSRGPQDLIPFVQGCLDLFAQDGPISRTTQPAVPRSAPQANEPPEVVLSAMKWLPKPSFRTAVCLGALAAVSWPHGRAAETAKHHPCGRFADRCDDDTLMEP
jgi:protease I